MPTIQDSSKSDKHTAYFTWRPTYIFYLSRSVFLRMKNVSNKKLKTHILCSIYFFFQNRAVYKIMWKNFIERGRPQITIRCMHFACSIPKATNTHSEYVILIAFPLQKWLRERVSMLHYTYIVCLVPYYCMWEFCTWSYRENLLCVYTFTLMKSRSSLL